MKRLLLPAFLITTMLAFQANADTITLQQGVNGYSGCTDTTIGRGGYNAEYYSILGDCQELRITTMRYRGY